MMSCSLLGVSEDVKKFLGSLAGWFISSDSTMPRQIRNERVVYLRTKNSSTIDVFHHRDLVCALLHIIS